MRNFFLPKKDQRLPDSYEVKIEFLDGTDKNYKLAAHRYMDQGIELVLFDDLFTFVPWSGIKTLNFDKQFSKIIALKEERDKKKEQVG